MAKLKVAHLATAQKTGTFAEAEGSWLNRLRLLGFRAQT